MSQSRVLAPAHGGASGAPLLPGSSLAAVGARAMQASGLTGLLDRLGRARGCLLTFHRAVPTASWAALPNRDFYLDTHYLAALLDYLRAEDWDIVTMDEALRRATARDPGRYVNISVDDTYRDTWEVVLPVFRRAGVPVTLFVTTGIPDGTLSLWAAGLETVLAEADSVLLPRQDRLEQVALGSAAQRRRLFQALHAEWERDGPELAYRRFCALNGQDAAALRERHAMDWDMLAMLRHDRCAEIGAHTISHPRISALAPAEAMAEIAGSRQRLEARLGIQVRHFAFPFGRQADCGPRDFALARQAGFASAATTRKGVLRPGAAFDSHALPRNTLNGAHRQPAQVAFHLTGLSGIAARLLKAV